MSAFLHHFAFEFKTGLRSSTSLLMNYLFPLGFYAMMGLIMTRVNPLFTDTMVPALVIFSAMASGVLGLPGPLVESREAGIYRSYKVNGVPATSILIVPALTTAFHIIIVSAIIAFTAGPLFEGSLPQNWGAFALLTLLTAFSFCGFGALIGVISQNTNTTVLWSQLIFLPAMLLGGLMMPLSILPDSILPFSGLLPATHAMQAYLGFAYGQEAVIAPFIAAALLLAAGTLAFALAIYLFNWDRRNDARRGHPLLALLAVAPFILGAVMMI